MENESATGIETAPKTGAYKAVIVVLALAIVIVGGLLLVKTFGPQEQQGTTLTEEMSSMPGMANEGAVMEMHEDADGNITFREAPPEEEAGNE